MATNHRSSAALDESDLGYALNFCAQNDPENETLDSASDVHPDFYMTRTGNGVFRAPPPRLIDRERSPADDLVDALDSQNELLAQSNQEAYFAFHCREHHGPKMSAVFAPGYEPILEHNENRHPRRPYIAYDKDNYFPKFLRPSRF